jgi:hypothetical protein
VDLTSRTIFPFVTRAIVDTFRLGLTREIGKRPKAYVLAV